MTIGKPMTVMDAVDHVAADHLLLPGIQRNFVWRPRQIAALFDSLLRGYPIGTLLLWKTKPMDHPQLRFRRLVTDYHGPSTTPKTTHPPKTSVVFAVLDGQQRLTALNVGLRGTHATLETGNSRSLFMDLDYEAPDAGAEANEYRFEFLPNGVDEGVDPTVELASIEIRTPSRALDDLRPGQPLIDVALAEGADDRLGIADQRRVIDDGAAVRGNRGSHGPQPARATAAPLALADEVELVLRHRPDHTQGV